MQQKIKNFNRYLLEHYPAVWNTKIVWMLLAGIMIHIIFFFIGYISHADPKSLHKFNVMDDYFSGGMIFIHLIISILTIVGWLILMFKNNAFKNFYPVTKWQMFSQFLQYFIIIFTCTSFFFSYMAGFKLFVKNTYPDGRMSESIAVINRTYPFFSQDLENYTLDNKIFPQYPQLFCETHIEKINRNKKYFVYYDRVYQYYTLYSRTVYEKDNNGDYPFPGTEPEDRFAYSEKNDSSETYYFKKEVVDLSPYIKTTGLTFYNFSSIFYRNNLEEKSFLKRNYYNDPYIDYNKNAYWKEKSEASRLTAQLLDKRNPAEIEKLMNDFLRISREFGISNNLDAVKWAEMVCHPEDFEVRYFIKKYETKSNEEYDPNRNSQYDDYGYATSTIDSAATVVEGQIVNNAVQIKDFNPDISSQLSPEDYFMKNITGYYYHTDDLKNFLGNVDTVKSTDFFSENIHIYLWIAFFLATVIFSFRVTDLKSLLFSMISGGILSLVVVLITVLYSVSGGRGSEEFFIAYLVFGIGLFILSVPLLMMRKFKKLVSSIFITVSMNGFVLFVLLLFFIVSLHQEKACRDLMSPERYSNCKTVIETLGFSLSYIILAIGFVFMYFYTGVLKKWKAMPE
ncbi:hypothetical protein SD427_11715 [Chryseobacterium sp. JJR-5R]|uniref:hypothetical protein n=1 Tax=Chryseobacterium sp. JJR-5R TaxID=3093923 RepID=UPI002A754410|nr:hypothetical protein [Chryseobacterium sp. JJR-5R]WPO81429.1 hypothetical protein SD427_11715 [Chryseobacterium sp. JJR-5R]